MNAVFVRSRSTFIFHLFSLLLALSVGSLAFGAGEGKIDVNTATVEELQTLPGIGKEIAQRIVQYRQNHGPFTQIDELKNVKGIGKGKLVKLQEHVTIMVATQPAKGH